MVELVRKAEVLGYLPIGTGGQKSVLAPGNCSKGARYVASSR